MKFCNDRETRPGVKTHSPFSTNAPVLRVVAVDPVRVGHDHRSRLARRPAPPEEAPLRRDETSESSAQVTGLKSGSRCSAWWARLKSGRLRPGSFARSAAQVLNSFAAASVGVRTRKPGFNKPFSRCCVWAHAAQAPPVK